MACDGMFNPLCVKRRRSEQVGTPDFSRYRPARSSGSNVLSAPGNWQRMVRMVSVEVTYLARGVIRCARIVNGVVGRRQGRQGRQRAR